LLKQFLISPPFGNWIGHDRATRVMGSYTIERRSGLLLQMARTLRPVGQGWVNRIGLRNPGIDSINYWHRDRLYSLAGLHFSDWDIFSEKVPRSVMIEINLNCPNEDTRTIGPARIRQFRERHQVCSVKVSPTVGGFHQAAQLGGLIHMGNSFPLGRGGYSGPDNKRVVLPLVEMLAKLGCRVIAGGGVRTLQDVTDYRNAGASHISLSTAWFRPWNAHRVISNSPEFT
jgi:dihydroorotate dehydrogenase